MAVGPYVSLILSVAVGFFIDGVDSEPLPGGGIAGVAGYIDVGGAPCLRAGAGDATPIDESIRVELLQCAAQCDEYVGAAPCLAFSHSDTQAGLCQLYDFDVLHTSNVSTPGDSCYSRVPDPARQHALAWSYPLTLNVSLASSDPALLEEQLTRLRSAISHTIDTGKSATAVNVSFVSVTRSLPGHVLVRFQATFPGDMRSAPPPPNMSRRQEFVLFEMQSRHARELLEDNPALVDAVLTESRRMAATLPLLLQSSSKAEASIAIECVDSDAAVESLMVEYGLEHETCAAALDDDMLSCGVQQLAEACGCTCTPERTKQESSNVINIDPNSFPPRVSKEAKWDKGYRTAYKIFKKGAKEGFLAGYEYAKKLGKGNVREGMESGYEVGLLTAAKMG